MIDIEQDALRALLKAHPTGIPYWRIDERTHARLHSRGLLIVARGKARLTDAGVVRARELAKAGTGSAQPGA